jgi:hypothetical protein
MILPKSIIICIDGECFNGHGRPIGLPPFSYSDAVLEKTDTAEESTGHYSNLFVDASVIQSIRIATQYISDSGTRAALESGIVAAVKAMEKRGAKDKVTITLSN